MDYKFIISEYFDYVSRGDSLQKLSEYIDWSIFEAPLDQAVLCITMLGQVLVADVFINGAGAATNHLMLFINQYDQAA